MFIFGYKSNKNTIKMKKILLTLGLTIAAITMSFNGISQSSDATVNKAETVEVTKKSNQETKKACCAKGTSKKACAMAKSKESSETKTSGVAGSKQVATAKTGKSCSKSKKGACCASKLKATEVKEESKATEIKM